MIKVRVTVGIGAWTASAYVSLVACPHTGDFIDVGGVTVTCEQVTITPKEVLVEQVIRFASEEDAKEYFNAK